MMNISFLSLDHDFTPGVWPGNSLQLWVKLRPKKIHRQTLTVFGKISGLRQRLQEWCHRTAFQGVWIGFFFGFFGTEENPTLEPTVGGFLHGRGYGLLCWPLR